MSTDPMEPIIRRLRAERETSPWWSTCPHPEDRRDADAPPPEPAPGSLWDDSETNCARRQALLDQAAARMENHYREDTA